MSEINVTYRHETFPRVDEVILTQINRGEGKDHSDPCRTVTQVHHKDGTFIAEMDPVVNMEKLRGRLDRVEDLLNRVLICDQNANILNGACDLREAILRYFDPEPA